jgi:hypothetical protein
MEIVENNSFDDSDGGEFQEPGMGESMSNFRNRGFGGFEADESFFTVNRKKTKKQKKREERAKKEQEKLDDLDFEFEESKENRIRAARLRKQTILPFKPDPITKDESKRNADKKRYDREFKKFNQFNERYGKNIFLMNFYRALQTVIEVKDWLFTSKFYTKEVKNTQILKKSAPKYARKTKKPS